MARVEGRGPGREKLGYREVPISQQVTRREKVAEQKSTDREKGFPNPEDEMDVAGEP